MTEIQYVIYNMPREDRIATKLVVAPAAVKKRQNLIKRKKKVREEDVDGKQ